MIFVTFNVILMIVEISSKRIEENFNYEELAPYSDGLTAAEVCSTISKCR